MSINLDLPSIDLVGDFLSPFGYGLINRDLLTTLSLGGFDVRMRQLGAPGTKLENPELMERIQSDGKLGDAPVRLCSGHPDTWIAHPKSKRLGFYVWNTMKRPSMWDKLFSRMHGLVVPHASGLQHKGPQSVLMPCPDKQFWSVPGEPLKLPGLKDDHALFCHVGEWNTASNYFDLISAFCDAFPARNDVHLVLVVQSDNQTSEAKRSIIETIRGHAVSLYGIMRPKIHVLPEILGDQQLRGLFTRSSAYVSLSHGCGFDPYMLRAALNGCPIIGCPFLHGADLCPNYPVPYSLMPVYGENIKGMDATQRWARPDLDVAAQHMRALVTKKRDFQVVACDPELQAKNFAEILHGYLASKT